MNWQQFAIFEKPFGLPPRRGGAILTLRAGAGGVVATHMTLGRSVLPLVFCATVVAQSQLAAGQVPARDAAPRDATIGRGGIQGRVLAEDSKKPLRRARVTLSSTVLAAALTTSTDDQGRYEFKSLHAGRYQLVAVRNGYLRTQYGQRRALGAGRSLDLQEGQVMNSIDFALPRMAIIGGHVTDDQGEPIQRVSVAALRLTYSRGGNQLTQVGVGETDAAGAFRILELAPGDYWLLATTSETWTVRRDGREDTYAYSPTYFPGTTNLIEAAPTHVAVGMEASGVEFSLVAGRPVSVSGRVIDSAGQPLTGAGVYLSQQFASGTTGGVLKLMASTEIREDGTFLLSHVPTGSYVITVRATPKNGKNFEAASVPLPLQDADVSGITIVTSPGGRFRGFVETEDGRSPPFAPDRIRLASRAIGAPFVPLAPDEQSGHVAADWSFALTGVFAPSVIRAAMIPDGWRIAAVYVNGRDVADIPINPSDVDEALVRVVLSSHINSISGDVTDVSDKPTGEYTIVAFPVDDSKWGDESRFIRTARPDQNGLFQIRSLPEGRYLVVALDDVEPGQWTDKDFLQLVRPLATEVSITVDEKLQIHLSLRRSPQ